MKPFTYLSLFSGIEAATVAVKAAGLNWRMEAAFENDRRLCEFLAIKYLNIRLYSNDIKVINFSSFSDINLIIGGSPCQDFSTAGKMAGITGERSSLFRVYIKAVKETNADYFVWENVCSPEADKAAEIMEKELNEYGVAKFKIDSLDINGLMRRRRLFVVGARTRIDRIAGKIHQSTSGKNRRSNYRFGVALTRSGNKNRFQIFTIPCLMRDGNKRPLVLKQKEGIKIYNLTARAYEILFGLPLDYTKELGSNFQRLMAIGNTFDVNIVGRIFEAINSVYFEEVRKC
jgi:site-specific DNA-cytosine methylase